MTPHHHIIFHHNLHQHHWSKQCGTWARVWEARATSTTCSISEAVVTTTTAGRLQEPLGGPTKTSCPTSSGLKINRTENSSVLVSFEIGVESIVMVFEFYIHDTKGLEWSWRSMEFDEVVWWYCGSYRRFLNAIYCIS